MIGRAEAFRILRGTWGQLLGNLWWAGVLVVGYVLVPIAVIRWVLGHRLADYGIGWHHTTRYLPWAAALAAPIVGFAFVVSFTAEFQHTYPFYRLAGHSWFDLLAWQSLYLLQFICLEFFFRGFLLHALARVYGARGHLPDEPALPDDPLHQALAGGSRRRGIRHPARHLVAARRIDLAGRIRAHEYRAGDGRVFALAEGAMAGVVFCRRVGFISREARHCVTCAESGRPHECGP